ncbi:MAG: hypothetical protein Q8M26_12385 [Pseudolabrys sp.]|nr:hypothetical protein [Pseudolabrys sp.]
MRQLMRGGACVALMLAGGCATDVGPTPAELKARWEAQNVYPAEYKNDLLAFMRTYLNDPTRVRAAAVSQPMLKSLGPGDRYVVCVRYDARNNDGKYMGVKGGYASYVSGKLDRYFDVPREVSAMCKDTAFAPFPELEKLAR